MSTGFAQTYFRCGNSNRYHVSLDCEGLRKCKRDVINLDETQASKLKICGYCRSRFDDRQYSTPPAPIRIPHEKSSSGLRTPHFYWLRYLLLGIATGLFKIGKRWEVIGAAIGFVIFFNWLYKYIDANTFKLQYCLIQSSLFALGFSLSQTLITQIYKNRKSDSLITSIMNALHKSETELQASKKKNDGLEQQIIKLNLTRKQTEEALRQSQQIILQLKAINPETNSSKIVPVENEKHRRYLIDALKKAENRIVITSGWIRNNVITDEFKSLFKACLDRNVDVFIFYGYVYGNEHNYSDKEALDYLEKMNAQYTNFIFRNHLTINVDGITGNHSKILIQDTRFIVLGSFNWLSNSGKLKNNLEMSMATNDSKTIIEVLSKLSSQ